MKAGAPPPQSRACRRRLEAAHAASLNEGGGAAPAIACRWPATRTRGSSSLNEGGGAAPAIAIIEHLCDPRPDVVAQ